MDYRNPEFNSSGGINCEINHPGYGWIPFSCDLSDQGAGFNTTGLFATMALTARAYTPPTVVITGRQVDTERDRRLGGTMMFQGRRFGVDAASTARITGGATLAGFAMMAGAPAGYLYWHGETQPFTWIAADNSFVQMDAQTMFAFGKATAENISTHIFAARLLKDLTPIPLTYQDDKFWPTQGSN